MLVGFSANTWIVLALRQAKRRQSNQYATGSELVESFFHLGFKTACKHEDAATPGASTTGRQSMVALRRSHFFQFSAASKVRLV
jgi:hypothetical protein